jgi:hypothetical protein
MQALTGEARKKWIAEHGGQEPPEYSPNVERILAQSRRTGSCLGGQREPWHEVVINPRKFRKKA